MLPVRIGVVDHSYVDTFESTIEEVDKWLDDDAHHDYYALHGSAVAGCVDPALIAKHWHKMRQLLAQGKTAVIADGKWLFCATLDMSRNGKRAIARRCH